MPFTKLTSIAFLMAAIAGFTDVISFIGVNHLFTAHITGNIVIAISDIINHDPGILPKITAIPIFIVFAGVMTWLVEKNGKTTRLLVIWFTIEAVLLAIFMIGGVFFLPGTSVNSKQYFAVGMTAVCAMAIHNTLLRTYMTTLPPCTVMTGNLTQFIIDGVTFFLNWGVPTQHEKFKDARGAIKRYGNVLLGFIVGGIFSAFGYYWFGFWITLLPIIVIVAIIITLGKFALNI